MADCFPDVIRIESSGICNFNCIHCSNGQKHPLRGLLEKEVFEKLIKQFMLNQFIPRVVVLYHGGEPLINEKLYDYISYFIKHGVKKVKINSNASLLSEKNSVNLIEAGITDIEFSFDGTSAKENDKIRKNGAFYRDAGNVLRFIRLVKEYNKDIKIHIHNIQILKREDFQGWTATGEMAPAQYIVDYFSEYLDEIEIDSFPAYVWPDYDRNTMSYGIMKNHSNTSSKNYCDSLFETITILSNGDVVPCCYDIKGGCVMGNIKEDSIFDIWNNNDYVRLRDSIGDGKPYGICCRCPVFTQEYLVKE